ncbi:MAG: lysylphosphatidylglycerol synthase domain-containing protein [Alphaproteobacteria bacterium]|nr:lysylphosphatidylglycerol synthase domain-containing protein [Alphaproteobacteria bacterium]
MSAKAKRLLKRLVSWSGILFFIIAAGMLYWQLRHYSLYDIARALWHIPFMNLVYASLAALAGYVALSFYDYLALRYINKMVSWWKWMLAGMIGFAISNNAGHAVVSGGAIRYRLYTRWRIRAGDIVKMLTYNGFTYFLGCTAIVVIGYFMVPHALFRDSVGASIGVHGLFIFCVAALGAYFAMTQLFRNKTIKLGELHFQIPTTRMAAFQMFLGILDSVLAGLVLYFCLIPFVEIPFTTFIGLFVIAQTAGVFSQVPGGIGVFESIFLLALPGDVNRASIFGALLAYRIIYYVLPLIGAGGLFLIYENWLRAKMKRWLAEAQALAQKIPKPKLPKIPHLPRKNK